MTGPASLLPNQTPYDSFINAENFRLAWERVRYFDRLDSRDWIGLKVFAANRDYNLESIRLSVIERTFEPSYPEIKYFPKPSLTLRPMAILPVRDRIVYQALATVIAEKARPALGMISDRQSFANVLAEPDEKRFFVHWKHQYNLFQDVYCQLIEEGNVWVAETDIAAFYETIDHSHLFRSLLENHFLDERTIEYLEAYLPIWGSVRPNQRAIRGVPQGCLASDLLANVFLCEFDHELARQDFYYLRYVDDIRLAGKTKDVVQRGLIKIDIYLKSLGIILQTKKTKIREVTDTSSEKDRLSAELSELDRRLDEIELSEKIIPDPLLHTPLHNVALLGIDFNGEYVLSHSTDTAVQDDLKELLWKSKASIDRDDDSDPYAERHLKFCLNRLEPNEDIVEAVIPYITERPWLCETITSYFHRNSLAASIKSLLINLLTTHAVHDSVLSHVIDVLVRQGVSLRTHQEILKQWLMDESREWPLRCSASIALGESSDSMPTLLKSVESISPFTRRAGIIQALQLSRNQSEAIHIFRTTIKDQSPIVIDTLLFLLYNEWGLTLNDVDSNMQSVSDYCVVTAKGYDSTLPEIQPDFIRYVFSKDYSVKFSDTVDFHALLGKDYKLADQHLWTAQSSFLVNPDRYIAKLDLFHEELLYPILVDKLSLKKSRKELAQVEWTDRIRMLISNKPELINFGGALQECRLLRANPETHTRLHKQLTVTNSVTWRQRNTLKKKLRAGYQELVDWLIAGCP